MSLRIDRLSFADGGHLGVVIVIHCWRGGGAEDRDEFIGQTILRRIPNHHKPMRLAHLRVNLLRAYSKMPLVAGGLESNSNHGS